MPQNNESLTHVGNYLVSKSGRRYPIVDGIPVMLLGDEEQTMGVAYESLICANDVATGKRLSDEFFVDTLGINDTARRDLTDFIKK